jgi:hypothetical protein
VIPSDRNEPLVLRPSRERFALWTLSVTAPWGCLFVLVLVTQNGYWLLSFLSMAVSCFSLFLPSVLMTSGFRGSTVVDASGVIRRLGRSHVQVPWEQIERISFAPAGPAWAGYRLVLFRRLGPAINLPAPMPGMFTRSRSLAARLDPIYARAGAHRPRVASRPFTSGSRITVVTISALTVGVLAIPTTLTIFLTSPWTQTWWPGRDEASRLPDSCTVIDQATIARLVPKAKPHGTGDSTLFPRDRSCSWGTDDPPPEMSVRLEMLERITGAGGGASERAHDFFTSRNSRDCASTISGVGDEACTGAERNPDGSTQVQVLTRKGNVLVTVTYRATRPIDQLTDETTRVTRSAIGRIHFD